MGFTKEEVDRAFASAANRVRIPATRQDLLPASARRGAFLTNVDGLRLVHLGGARFAVQRPIVDGTLPPETVHEAPCTVTLPSGGTLDVRPMIDSPLLTLERAVDALGAVGQYSHEGADVVPAIVSYVTSEHRIGAAFVRAAKGDTDEETRAFVVTVLRLRFLADEILAANWSPLVVGAIAALDVWASAPERMGAARVVEPWQYRQIRGEMLPHDDNGEPEGELPPVDPEAWWGLPAAHLSL